MKRISPNDYRDYYDPENTYPADAVSGVPEEQRGLRPWWGVAEEYNRMNGTNYSADICRRVGKRALEKIRRQSN